MSSTVSPQSRVNRGPAAAASNRQAILDAARVLLREQGYSVPLSAIARRADVSQGVLYRHFRDRASLAYAVFEENFEVLGGIAQSDDPGIVYALWDQLLDYAVTDHGFVEVLLSTPGAGEDYDGLERLQEIMRPALDRAKVVGLVPQSLSPEMIAWAWRMAYGVSALSAKGDLDTEVLRQALTLPKIAMLFAREQ